MLTESVSLSPAECARFIRERIPSEGLFFEQEWRISPVPFPISPEVAAEFQTLGRVLLQFYRAVNLLYRQSAAGLQPGWIADVLAQPGNTETEQRVRKQVAELAAKFPIYESRVQGTTQAEHARMH